MITDKEKFKELYVKQNRTPEEVANFFGTAVQTVYSFASRHNIHKAAPRQKITKQKLKELYHDKNMLFSEIAEYLNCSTTCIQRHIKKHNLNKSRAAIYNEREKRRIVAGNLANPNQKYSNEAYKKLRDKDWLQKQSTNKSIMQIASEIQADPSTVMNWFNFHDIKYNSFNYSSGEQHLKEFISEIYSGEIIHNTKTIITPYELDIFLPELNIALEYCGLYWHSSKFKKNDYHFKKWQMCNDQDIQLITIFENEWNNKKDIVKQMIARKLGIIQNKSIGARKCNITEDISINDIRNFYNANHIQGFVGSTKTIGLEYNNDLVAMMSFLKKGEHIYEINRYATSQNVPGGFTKILNYFEQHHKIDTIYSFADLRWSNGELYEKCGFELKHQTKPIMYYTDFINIYYRSNFMKSKLKNKLELFDPILTEKQNCENNGLYQIYNCGLKKYEKR